MKPERVRGISPLPSCPERVQRKRTKGWRLPPNTVYVGRPTKWGNPFVGDGPINHKKMADLYRDYIRRSENSNLRIVIVKELSGKNLACWCPLDKPCHADVLLELAIE